MVVFRRPTAALVVLVAAASFALPMPAPAQSTSPAPSAPPAMTPLPAMTPEPAMTPAPMSPAPMSPAPAVTPTPGASPGSSPAPLDVAANPPENPLITMRVRREFAAWQRGRIDRSTYSPFAGGTYPDALVQVVAPDLAIGTVQDVRYQTASLLLGDLVYRYDVSGPGGVVSVLYALDSRGKTDAVVFTPQVFRAAPAAAP